MSRAESQSAPSDYDFGEIPQDDEDDDLNNDLNLMRPDLQRLDMNVMMVLNRFPLKESIMENFSLYHITYSQLKSLNRDDLIKLGIDDNKLQDEMLEEFTHLEGQDPTLDEVHASTSKVMDHDNESIGLEKDTSPESNSIVETLQQHIFRLNTLLTAISFQLGTSSSSSSGVIINQRFCSTTLVMDLVGQLSQHTAEMEEILRVLSEPEKYEETEAEYKKKKQKERNRNCIVLVSTIGFFIAGIYLAKRLGFKKIF